MRAAFKSVMEGQAGSDTDADDRACLSALRHVSLTLRAIPREGRTPFTLSFLERTEGSSDESSRQEKLT
jgi:hypothetical protein